jgi:hypothetical protein
MIASIIVARRERCIESMLGAHDICHRYDTIEVKIMTLAEQSSLTTTTGGGFTRHLASPGGSYSTYISGTVRQTLGHFLISSTMLKVKLDTQETGYSNEEPL